MLPVFSERGASVKSIVSTSRCIARRSTRSASRRLEARSTRAAVSFAIAAPTSRFCALEQTGVAQRGRRPLPAGCECSGASGQPKRLYEHGPSAALRALRDQAHVSDVTEELVHVHPPPRLGAQGDACLLADLARGDQGIRSAVY